MHEKKVKGYEPLGSDTEAGEAVGERTVPIDFPGRWATVNEDNVVVADIFGNLTVLVDGVLELQFDELGVVLSVWSVQYLVDFLDHCVLW